MIARQQCSGYAGIERTSPVNGKASGTEKRTDIDVPQRLICESGGVKRPVIRTSP
jgi:hypothetical protein